MPKGLKGFQKGGAPFKGKKHTSEAKEKIRLANLGEKSPAKRPEVREKMRIAHLGKKLPQEQIDKIVASRSWYKHSEETKEKQRLSKIGKNNPSYGRKPTREHRLKISESLKKTLGRTGDINFQELQHEIRHSPTYKLWREAVYERDGYVCQECGYSGGKTLNADHVNPFILIIRTNAVTSLEEALTCRELWDIGNGKTLCYPCHKLTPTFGAKAKKLI